MLVILMVPRIIALLTGFTSLSVKSDRYKLLCVIARKKSMFILQPVVQARYNPGCRIYILLLLVAASLLTLCCRMAQEEITWL